MKRTWEQEKAYREKRANELRDLMVEDIKRNDKNSFEKHMQTAIHYMKKRDRYNLFIAFVSHMNN